MRNTILALLVLSFAIASKAQESKIQKNFGEFFADLSLDSSADNWEKAMALSTKFKIDSSFNYLNNIYQIADKEELQKIIPELDRAFFTAKRISFNRQDGLIKDTVDFLNVRIHLADSLSKTTAKDVYKRLRKIANSTFPYIREDTKSTSNEFILRCNNQQFSIFTKLEICIIHYKETGGYAIGLSFSKQKEE
jgi:hypothetical protein